MQSGIESKSVEIVVVEIAAYKIYDLQNLFSLFIRAFNAFIIKMMYKHNPTNPNAVNMIE